MREVEYRFWYKSESAIFSKVFTLNQIMNGYPYEEISDSPLLRDYKMLDIREQYAGLKDKNGKKIFEGDKQICRMNGVETHIEEVETIVVYNETVGAFCNKVISKDSYYEWFGLNSKDLLGSEIIGNIHQEEA